MTSVDFQNSKEFLPKKLFLKVCVAIVKESLEQLSILKIINNWPEDRNTPYTYETMQQRVDELNVRLEKENDADSFHRNCVFVKSLLDNFLRELTEKNTYEEFKTALEAFNLMKSDEKNLLSAASHKGKVVETLQARLSDEKSDLIERILNCMTEIGKIKDDIENFQIEGDIKLEYVAAWKNSQIEMTQIRLTQKNQDIQEEIDRTNVGIAQEGRVHHEISSAYNLFENELETKVEEWKQKYSSEMGKFNAKIGDLQVKQNQQLDKIRDIKELYAKRQKEIENYKQYKIEQEKLRKEIERNTVAATIIQAWWRGTMVRKGFGKYKKKKEKKVKKKSSEKKSPE